MDVLENSRLQEASPKQVDVQDKMIEGFLGNDFERRLQGTQNFSLSGFLWGVEYMKQGNILVKMRGEGAS
jgi:hypothetical protein